MSENEYVIKTENLSKTYGWFIWKKKEASLTDLNLSIPEGSVFGFLGPNGAGKTTTIRLLMDLIKPSAGSATVLGKPTDDVKVKHKIGFLPDSPAFSSHLSAYEFLLICSKLLKIPSGERKKRIDEVVETVKMTKHIKSKLGGFSRGMLQRIGIAQAILNKPKLLILDEPLVGLDPYGRQELKDIIFEQKKSGTNVFFCSHILSDVQTICDSIGILNRGRLLCSGTISELLSEKSSVVHIAPGNDNLAKDIMADALSSQKIGEDGWELEFPCDKETKAKLKEIKNKNSDAVTITPSMESLEDFFFKTIKNAESEPSVDKVVEESE